MRYPTTQNASAVSQNDLMAQRMDSYAGALRSRLFTLFTNYNDYATFSNEAWIPQNNPEGYDSIESVHDLVHGVTGGTNGHMAYIEYSAFDPIFFLHHAMIDRCFAMWQVLYPDSYVVPEPATYSTFTNSAGQTQDSSTSLTPFYEDPNGDFWTSDSVRSTETFGYAYAETANSPGANITSQVISAINSLYGTTVTSLPQRKRDKSMAIRKRDPGAQYREWIANLKVEKNALSEPFFIHLFIGPFDTASPSSWPSDPNLVGSHFIFTKATNSLCTSCDPHQLVTATIPITNSVSENVANGKLASMEPTDVEPFLMSNLKYRITRLNDQEVGNGDVPSLKISIVSANVTMPVEECELPSWGQMVGHMDVSTA
jgi:tyrosinase